MVKLFLRLDLFDKCPICGNDKNIYSKNCSLTCAGKSKAKIDWSKINLGEEIKNKSVVLISEELGCSDAAVHKRLKKLGLK